MSFKTNTTVVNGLVDTKITALALGTASKATLGTAEGNVPVLGVDGKLNSALLPSGSAGGPVSYNDLTDKPTLFSGAYADLTGKPTLGTAAAASTNDFAAKVHTHVAADITDLNSVVDGKISTAIAAIPAPVADTSMVALRTVAANTTLAAGDHVVLVTAAVTITLPAPVNGKMIVVKNVSASNTVTVDGGSAMIDGAATVVISGGWESVTVVSNGTAWFAI